ncbi:hypothetical protein [Halorussus halobius]|uniref:hypothetical protein n=1 Tax=Halorussus halobius TaxID=1710537 RepID=UPI001092375B|nr:hypothetical protein [Halorussus halobius]
MSNSRASFGDAIREWREDGRLYLWGGAASAVVSWVVIPLFGVFAMYSGYRLYDDHSKVAIPAVLAGFGGVAVLLWVNYLASL